MNTHANPLDVGVFDLSREDKRSWLLEGLCELDDLHYSHCRPYANMLDAMWQDWRLADRIEQLPWLPVRLFKHLELKSVPDTEVSRTLVSSGTTGASVSKIILDADTARQQARALTRIFGHFAGTKRLPMLIIDEDGFLRDRSRFNARAAAILGFSNFGRDHLYLLDQELKPDWDKLSHWLSQHNGQPIFLFGFTFIVWQSLIESAQAAGRQFRFPHGSLLVHGGGWKRMEQRKVDNQAFKAALKCTFGIERVHNYYGMVEQVGSIFFECQHGHLHAPTYADIIIRDPNTLSPTPVGVTGVVQVLSLLPRSYPGHSLLTEDIGVLHGEDDCPCGRLGKHFSILGRLKNVEIRGCSDTRKVPAL